MQTPTKKPRMSNPTPTHSPPKAVDITEFVYGRQRNAKLEYLSINEDFAAFQHRNRNLSGDKYFIGAKGIDNEVFIDRTKLYMKNTWAEYDHGNVLSVVWPTKSSEAYQHPCTNVCEFYPEVVFSPKVNKDLVELFERHEQYVKTHQLDNMLRSLDSLTATMKYHAVHMYQFWKKEFDNGLTPTRDIITVLDLIRRNNVHLHSVTTIYDSDNKKYDTQIGCYACCIIREIHVVANNFLLEQYNNVVYVEFFADAAYKKAVEKLNELAANLEEDLNNDRIQRQEAERRKQKQKVSATRRYLKEGERAITKSLLTALVDNILLTLDENRYSSNEVRQEKLDEAVEIYWAALEDEV